MHLTDIYAHTATHISIVTCLHSDCTAAYLRVFQLHADLQQAGSDGGAGGGGGAVFSVVDHFNQQVSMLKPLNQSVARGHTWLRAHRQVSISGAVSELPW